MAIGDGFTILSIEHRIDYKREADRSVEIVALQQELEAYTDRLTEQRSLLELCDLEESFFKTNSALAGTDTGLKASELRDAVLFYNERMADIRQKRIAYNREIQKLEEAVALLKAQLGSFQEIRRLPVSEVTVKVASSTNDVAKLTLSYYVPSASWQPSYDIRVRDIETPVLLHYKARVSQNTGEDWEDVMLKLSTGSPSMNGQCPDMKPWYIDFYTPPMAAPAELMRKSPRSCELSEMEECITIAEPAPRQPAASVSRTPSSVEYSIKEPYSIKSGDGGQTVEIITNSLPARYRHFSACKLEKEVFLLAAVKDWEGLDLIAGEASIFFENRYVGKTFIDPRSAGEEINLSLGVDRSVIVTRVRGKDFTEKTLIGGSIKQTRQWELTVRNLKSVPIAIQVVDQIPVSLNKQIAVDAVETSEAEHDNTTGILTWTLSLEPAASRKIVVKYVVTQPKNTTVVLE